MMIPTAVNRNMVHQDLQEGSSASQGWVLTSAGHGGELVLRFVGVAADFIGFVSRGFKREVAIGADMRGLLL